MRITEAHGQCDSKARTVGFPSDQLKFITSILLTYPAASLFHLIPRTAYNQKHLFSIILSITLITFCCGPYAWVHSFISSLVTYLILKFLPHGIGHKVAFAWAFGYMSCSHIYRLAIDYMGWQMDFTTMQMVLTLKLTAFAFNYYDGRRPVEKLTEEQKKRRITELPPLLEFFGFVYFFPGFLGGPAVEITEYQRFINYSMFEDSYCNGNIPDTKKPAFQALGRSLMFMPLVILSGFFPCSDFTDPKFALLPFWNKVIRMWIHPGLFRMKYYFGWYMSEGACNMVGIGYSGLDKSGKPKWDRCRNVTVTAVEIAPNMRSITTFWNLKTGDWLKNYVYLRLTPEGTRPTLTSTLLTYTASAFWHGFYPGYYAFFFMCAILTELGKDMRRICRPYFVTADDKPIQPRKRVYDVLTCLTTMWFINYAGTSQILLSWEASTIFWAQYYYLGHIIPLLALVLTRTVFKPKRVHQKSK
ncbi:hypothetical protein PROFUN_12008 [Planoprotostelium fungivorum]|uniref:Lysophospholipid acyltransferase n=1 Tax=Planoprotostelium fungivorum TaxID=1890364 RepID=A0A2P6MRC6_9EUKA|nr:hypothetical protein PROFUN_12008 [Planoprotostelium fungivorum]